jgi:hypothetical protein
MARGNSRHLALRRFAMGLVVLVVSLSVAIRLTAGARTLDDAFITFRHSLNLVDGLGLVYNVGEPVLGTSTPLYALLLAAVAWLSRIRAFPDLSLWVNTIADAVTVVLVFHISRRLRLQMGPALLASLLVALSPLVVRYSIGGMESSLVMAVCLTSTALYLHGKDRMAFLLAGLAVGVRPDALAFCAALLLAEAWRTRRVPWGPLAIVGSLVLVEVGLLTISYGDPVPQSVLAKANEVYTVNPATNLLQHVFLFSGLTLTGAQGFGARGLAVTPSPMLDVLALFAFLLLSPIWAVGSVRLVRGEPRSLVLPLFPLVFTVAYSLLGLRGGLMAEWYLVPLVPFWLIPVFFGLASISDGARTPARGSLVWMLPIALLAAELSGYNLSRRSENPASLPLNAWTAREALYQEAGAFLRENAGADDLVAAPEIGALGYSCRCTILDTVGLVSPSVVSYYPVPKASLVGNYAIPRELIADLKPAFLVSLDVFMRKTLLTDAQFLDAYQLVWEAPTSAFGSRGLMIFRRRIEP